MSRVSALGLRPRAHGRPRRDRGRTGLAVLLAGLLLVLTGCVDVPTSGPIQRVSGQQPPCESCVNVEVPPPAPGDSPREVVENYLRANANYQPNYAVAKQYLTSDAAAKWLPDTGLTVYSGTLTAVGRSTIVLSGEQVGFLDGSRSYTAQPSALRTSFRLKRELGQWRIDSPPPGLFVEQTPFQDLYQPYDVFFLGRGGTLVPQPVYLPNLRNADTVATALVNVLLGGPSTRLRRAVTTELPSGTRLSVDAVTIDDGTARVPLTEEVTSLSDTERTRLAAQLVYTLQQVTGVKRVQVLVGGQPFHVPESTSGDQAVPVGGVPPALDPIPVVAAEQLYAVRSGRLGTVGANADDPQVAFVGGVLGDGSHRVESAAVSLTTSTVAVVTDGGTVLRQAAADGSGVSTLLRGVSRLLRPQFSRNDELWVAGDRGGRQQLWLLRGAVSTPVALPAVASGRILAFRVSPDGTRIAAVVEDGGRTSLEVGLLRGTGRSTTISRWRRLDTRLNRSGPSSARPLLRDVAWTDATTLVVLQRNVPTGPFQPVELPDDGSSITAGRPATGWDGRSLSVVLRTKTPLVVTTRGAAFRDDGTAWQPYVRTVTALAGPG